MNRSRIGAFGVPAVVVAIVVMLVVPMPTFVLDMLITANLTAAVVVLLVTMHVQRPVDFASFPSLLLVATLFRLALNVSATRLILLHGHAGAVIGSFGHFVVGGSLAVGLVVFVILIVIQFVVVTNGAGRVAEVAARFTLDAMPGKQMAIDADLNSGLIGEAEARRRRREIADEADFYGAMDGASKFVRGDAIAAVVITMVNLIGGLAIGVLQRHLAIGQAASTYSVLSVGDGLVSQIPALLLSVSTGIIVTRAATDDDFGTDLISQLHRQERAIQMAGVVVAGLAVVPGLPHLPFLVIGVGVFLLGRRIRTQAAAQVPAPAAPVSTEPESVESLARQMRVEALELELAADLLDLVDPARGGTLLDRMRGLRRKVAGELGLVLPPVRTRDNLTLPSATYVIRVSGVEVARGVAPAGRLLAVGNQLGGLAGEHTREPVFGLPALWIPAERRHEAVVAGATVVDRASVITTHLGEVVNTHAARLLSVQQVRTLLDLVKATDPAAVEELATAQVSPGQLQKVLESLLEERVPIRDLARIVEAVAERARSNRSYESLVEAARSALAPSITAAYADDGRLPLITLEPELERSLLDGLREADTGTVLTLDPSHVETLVSRIGALSEEAEHRGSRPVLLCASRLRAPLARLLRMSLPRLGVVSVNELGMDLVPERIGVASLADAATV